MSCDKTGNEKRSLLSQDDDPVKRWKFLGYVSAIISIVIMVVATASSQALGDVVPVCQLMAFRYAAVFLLSATLCGIFRLDIRSVLDKDIIAYVIAYSLLDQAQLTALLFALNYISLITLNCLIQTLSIVLGFLGTYWCARVCNISQVLPTGLCIIGVILVTQPDFLFRNLSTSEEVSQPICGLTSHKQSAAPVRDFNASININLSTFDVSIDLNTSASKESDQRKPVYPGYISSCLCALIFTVMFFVGSEKLHFVNGAVLMFWDSLFGTIIMFCIMASFEKPSFPSGLTCISLLFGHLGSLAIGHLTFTTAVLRVPPLFMATLLTLNLVMGLCAQYTVLKHINPGHGNALEVIGAVIVMLGNIGGPFYEMFKLRRKAVEKESEIIAEMEVTGGK